MSYTDSNKSPGFGKLFLIPTPLGDVDFSYILPEKTREIVINLTQYIAENEKTIRHFIKRLTPTVPQSSLHFRVLNKHTKPEELLTFLNPCLRGEDMGLLSEAGCPGVADPGAKVVSLAHSNNIQVVPLVGPSSLLLAMMASGLNGQNFAFNGYLPIDKIERRQRIKHLEQYSFEQQQAQLFIETPYRNEKLLKDLLKVLHRDTKLCIASEITLPTEYIQTKTVEEWKKIKLDLHKKPTIFILQKGTF